MRWSTCHCLIEIQLHDLFALDSYFCYRYFNSLVIVEYFAPIALPSVVISNLLCCFNYLNTFTLSFMFDSLCQIISYDSELAMMLALLLIVHLKTPYLKISCPIASALSSSCDGKIASTKLYLSFLAYQCIANMFDSIFTFA